MASKNIEKKLFNKSNIVVQKDFEKINFSIIILILFHTFRRFLQQRDEDSFWGDFKVHVCATDDDPNCLITYYTSKETCRVSFGYSRLVKDLLAAGDL